MWWGNGVFRDFSSQWHLSPFLGRLEGVFDSAGLFLCSGFLFGTDWCCVIECHKYDGCIAIGG